MKHKVGEQVRVKSYKKLVEEFGRPDGIGDIYIAQDHTFFVAEMVDYCRKIVTITALNSDSQYFIDNLNWLWSDGMFEEAD